DLVTDDTQRSTGIGKALLDHLQRLARDAGCAKFTLDSGTQRQQAHKFYFREGLVVNSFHFAKALKRHTIPTRSARRYDARLPPSDWRGPDRRMAEPLKPDAPQRRARWIGVATALMCALAGGAIWCLVALYMRRDLIPLSLPIAAVVVWALRSH